MELRNNEGMVMVCQEEWEIVRQHSLDVRKLIIVYNKREVT